MNSTANFQRSQRRISKMMVVLLVAATGVLAGCSWDKQQPDVCFESDVLPVFRSYCSTSGCHNSTDQQSGFDFTSYAGILKESSPNRALSSPAVREMSGKGEEKMPPNGYPQPTSEQIAAIRAWAKAGAPNSTNCNIITCDTSLAVSFSGDLVPMLQNNCVGCHSASNANAGVDLSNYDGVKTVALGGSLVGVISGDPNYVSMPPNSPLLPNCYVNKIEKWIAEGTPNN